MSKISLQSGRWMAIALAGPILDGAILGLRAGPRAMLVYALGLPAILAAVTLLTTPTLYVGGAVFGNHLTLGQVAAATARSGHALGLALLGLAPLSLLLAATLPQSSAVPAQGMVLLVTALLVALHRLAAELREEHGDGAQPMAGRLLFAGHTLVAFIIGARLFQDLHRFGEGIAS